MYFILYNHAEEIICEDISQVLDNVIDGWKLYGYTDSEMLANSLLHECKFT